MRALGVAGMLSGLSLFCAVAPASASILDVTYTGTVALGFDAVGAFGHVGFLSGDSYKAEYVFDTSLGASFSPGFDNDATGGAKFGTTSPVLKASLTIDGHTVSITPGYDGEVRGLITTAGFDQQYHYAAFNPGTYIYNTIVSDSGTLPISITVPFSYTATGATASGGFDLDNNRIFGIFVPEALTYSLSAATQVPGPSVSATTPVPDACAMMLTGLIGLLFLLHRKRKLGALASVVAPGFEFRHSPG
ncbi:MAG TPA: hypothetical protein VKW08_03425 [Xanthobacteraceae bacterium]|jgi:hypothetical protein|nr:hypothetical protein [Xanthobacteraceae bacterium]